MEDRARVNARSASHTAAFGFPRHLDCLSQSCLDRLGAYFCIVWFCLGML